MVLLVLQEEEFSLLKGRNPQAITAVEFSIHNLMRQLLAERKELKVLLGGMRLREWLKTLPEEPFDADVAIAGVKPENLAGVTEAHYLRNLVASVRKMEQACARKAKNNTELAFALLDQSKALLSFMHQKITPKTMTTYSAKGRVNERVTSASMLRGAL